MSVRVMTAVWAIDLPDSEKIVLLALADCANDEGGCWPSMATLARKCSKSDRTVQASIKRLVDAGHLTRSEVAGKGCHYTVHPRATPEAASPPKRLHPRSHRAPPPKRLRVTPEAASDKPSKNHQEPSEVKAVAQPRLRPEHVVEAWNDMAERYGLSKVRALTDQRKRTLATRIRQHSIEDFTEAINAIPRSPFLLGTNDRHWKADFDFLLQPKSFTKLLEGSYGP